MAKITIDLKQIEEKAIAAFKETTLLMGNAFTQEISENKWGWPVEPSPRDVVDTGRLRSSQQLTFLSATQAQWSWNTDYALPVCLGYTKRNGKSYPGRNWVADGLKRFDTQKVFDVLLMAKLK